MINKARFPASPSGRRLYRRHNFRYGLSDLLFHPKQYMRMVRHDDIPDNTELLASEFHGFLNFIIKNPPGWQQHDPRRVNADRPLRVA